MLIWILLENCRSLQLRKKFTNRSTTDKVIAMVMLAEFFTHSVHFSEIYTGVESQFLAVNYLQQTLVMR